MKLILIGTGGSEGTPAPGCSCPTCVEARRNPRYRRRPTGILLYHRGGVIVVDPGTEAVVEKIAVEELKVKAILLTHWHHDHFAGLYRLRWIMYPVPLYAPRQGVDPEIARNPLSLKINLIDAYSRLSMNDLKIMGLPLNHSIETLGYLIEDEHSKRIAILQDTKGLPAETSRFLKERNIDLAVIDSTYAPGVDGEGHNNVDEAIRIGREIGAGRIVLTHIAHHNLPYTKLVEYVEENYSDAEIIVAYDNMVLEI